MHCRLSGVCLAFTLLSVPIPTTFGQTEKTTLRGTVSDPTGAVIPGATVIVTELATNIEARRVTTNEFGAYEIAGLKPGTFRVKVDLEGFESFVADDLLIDPGTVRRLDVRLQLGTASAEVNVVAGAAVIQTDTGEITAQVERKQFDDVPLVDVYPSPLALLTTTPAIQGNGWAVVMSGISDRNKQTWALDGVANDTTADQNDNPNFFETVQVNSVNGAADIARPTSFNMVSKHGGNSFHGGVYYKHENAGLNARGFFDPRNIPYILHEAEAEAGGPILKDRTFFFAGWMYQSIPLGSYLLRTFPTDKMRAGDFSEFAAVIRDPRTNQPFMNKTITSDRFNPVSVQIMNLYMPRPNVGGPDNLTNNYGFDHPYNNELYKGNWPFFRIDYKVTSHNNLYVRWMARMTPYVWPGPTPQMNSTQYRDHRQTVISDTHVFTANLVNSFTFGRSTDLLQQGEADGKITPLFGGDVVKSIGLQGVNRQGYHTMGFPVIAISGLTTLSMRNDGGLTDNKVTDDGINTYQDTLTWSKGKHVLKAGAEERRFFRFQGTLSSSVYGNFNFNGTFTGNGFADFLLGIPYTSSRLDPLVNRRSFVNQHGLFVSDTFKVASRLTLDYGLRWDYYGLPVYGDGLMYNWDPATGNVVVASGAHSKIHPLFPTSTIKVVEGDVVPSADWRNFRPRLSAAFRISQNMVMRGGYGEFTESYGYFDRLNGAGPYQLSESYNNVITNGEPLLSFPNPFPANLALSSVPGQSVAAIPMQTNQGLIRQFNFTVERQVASLGLRVSYIGSRGSGLNYSLNTNKPQASTIAFTNARRPMPQFVSTTDTRTDGAWRYSSLQLEVQRRVGEFTFNANYTLAGNLNNYSNTQDPYNVTNNWSRNGTDRRQYFVVSTTWQVPVGKGRRLMSNANAFLDYTIGGWALQTISTFASGQYFSPSFSGSDPSNTNTSGGLPDRICNGNLPGDQRTVAKWFDPGCFAPPAAGHFGNAGVNSLEGQGINVHHLSVAKSFPVTERVKTTLTAQISNLFNHPHFNNPNSSISNPNPGMFTSVVPNYNPEKQGFRQIDLKLRVQW